MNLNRWILYFINIRNYFKLSAQLCLKNCVKEKKTTIHRDFHRNKFDKLKNKEETIQLLEHFVFVVIAQFFYIFSSS